MLAFAIEIFTTVMTVAGIGYYLLALWSARDFARSLKRSEAQIYPSVSILKPVKGVDPAMYESFSSHCRQDYPAEYEMLFAVSSMDDPAVAAVERLQTEFPERMIRIVLCTMVLGTNGKMSNLAQALGEARGEIVLINDSDIRVSPKYLRRIAAGFSAGDAGKPVGMVTALYRGRAHQTVWSKMEALGISTDFMAGVLTARKMEGGIHFGLGSTLAVSRTVLDAIGGLAPLVDHLADDYELGVRVARAGYRVGLLSEVVETSIPAYSFRPFWAHQLRWARAVRDARKLSYLGVVFTFGLPWACLNIIASGTSAESIALCSVALLARVALALGVGVGIGGDRQVLSDLWLLLPRDLVALAVWAWSYTGHTVNWRGEEFALKDGKLYRI
jgi:ceramide glucosyltransferase